MQYPHNFWTYPIIECTSNKKITGILRLHAFLLLACTWFSVSQAQNPVFRHFGVENGLPSSEVYQSFQDQHGYMWFTTDLGLTRFDGYEFETFDIHSGLADNVNFIFFEDDKKRLWLSGYMHGLSCITDTGIVEYPYNHLVRQELANRVIRTFHVDEQNTLRVSAVGIGHILTIDSTGQVYREPLYDQPLNKRLYWVKEHSPYDALMGIYTTPKSAHPPHEIQFAIKGFDGSTQLIDLTIASREGKSLMGSLSSINFVRIDENEVALLTNGLLHIIKKGKKYLRREMPFSPTHSLTKDDEGNLWFGAYSQGLIIVPRDTSQEYRQYFKGTTVSHINKDREGGYWITTLNNGVYYIPDWKIKSAIPQLDAQHNVWIKALYSNKNAMFAGQDNGTLHQWELDAPGSPILKLENIQLGGRLLSISGRENQVFTTSNDSIRHYSSKEHIIENYIGRVTLPIDEKTFWVSGGARVYKYVNGEEVFNSVDDLGFTVNAVSLESFDSSLWIGHRNGLYELRDEKIINHSLLHQELNTRVNDIKVFREGMLMATLHGIFYYAHGKVTQLISRRNAAFNTCRTIEIENDTIVWVGTNTGLVQMHVPHPSNPSHVSHNQLFYRDGLSSGNIYDLELTPKYVWIGTTSGINFLPKNFSPTALPKIPIQITEVQVNGTPRKFTSGIELEPGNNDLLFTYKGLCLRCAGSVIYQYRLLNADTSWTETTSRTVQFANLPPGTYTFELRASSYSRNSQPSTKSIQFSIRPRIWEIPWVQWIAVLLAVGIVALLIRRRFVTIQKQNRFELEIDQLKFQALNAQMNPHFVFNAMNAIQQFVLKNDVLMSNKYLGKFARLTRLVLDNSREQLVDLQADLDALRLYIEIEALRFPGLFDWHIHLHPKMNPMSIKVPPLLLQPLVENSIKHGLVPKKGGGQLTISIDLDNDYLICTVEDNGIGREASSWAKNKRKDHKPVGLGNTKKRIELLESMHGKKVVYDITDLSNAQGEASGTRVNLKLPLLTSSFPIA